jgi:hypothetical protein
MIGIDVGDNFVIDWGAPMREELVGRSEDPFWGVARVGCEG